MLYNFTNGIYVSASVHMHQLAETFISFSNVANELFPNMTLSEPIIMKHKSATLAWCSGCNLVNIIQVTNNFVQHTIIIWTCILV